LTKKELVTSKGKEYVIYKGISASGGTVEVFLPREKADEYDIPDDAIATPEDLDTFFGNANKVVNVQFNERGRVDSVEVEK